MGFFRPVSDEYAITRAFGVTGKHYTFHVDPNTGLWLRAQVCSVCHRIAPCGCENPQPAGTHRGVDFGCPESTLVHAIADGVVIGLGLDQGCGEHVGGLRVVQLISKMGFDSYTVDYRHISCATVNLGHRVNAGDRIGYSGYDGPGAPYLHVEMRDLKGQFKAIEFDERGSRLLQTGRGSEMARTHR